MSASGMVEFRRAVHEAEEMDSAALRQRLTSLAALSTGSNAAVLWKLAVVAFTLSRRIDP